MENITLTKLEYFAANADISDYHQTSWDTINSFLGEDLDFATASFEEKIGLYARFSAKVRRIHAQSMINELNKHERG